MNRTINVSEDDIAAFKEWLKQEPTLPDDTDDNIIRCFIIGRKGSLHEAKKRYLAFRRTFQEDVIILREFSDFNSDKWTAFHRTAAACYLPKKTRDGYSVLVSKLLSSDPSGYTYQHHLVQALFQAFCYVKSGRFGNAEKVILVDWTGAQMGHFNSISLEIISRILSGLRATPFRIKAIYIIGVPSFAEWLLKFTVKIMPEKIAKRVQILSKQKEIFDYFDKDVIPIDFGGLEKPLKEIQSDELAELRKINDWMQDEMKNWERERKLLNISDSEIMETFHKLEID